MSFLDTLFGSKAKTNDAQKAYTDANATLNAGLTGARSALTTGLSNQLGSLAGGYGNARSDITSGYGNARTSLGTGYDAARDVVTNYGNAATGYLDPFVKSGYGAQGLLDNYYGVNGATAQGDMARNFADANNPLTAYRDEMATKALDAAYNARGLGTSGRAATAVSRASLERKAQDFSDYLGNVNLGANRGLSAAGSAAGIKANIGNTLGQIESNRGTGLAGLDTGQAGALGSLDYGYGGDVANLYGSNANNLANLEYGNAQQLAGNRINLGNAYAATRGSGVNNLLGAAGLAIQGFMPSKMGSSAFGNIGNALSGKGWV